MGGTQQGASKSRAKDLWPGDGENLEGRLCEGGHLWLDGKIGASGTLLIPPFLVSQKPTHKCGAFTVCVYWEDRLGGK